MTSVEISHAAAEILRCLRDAAMAMPPHSPAGIGYSTAITYFAPTSVVREFARISGGDLRIHAADANGDQIVASSTMLLGVYVGVQGTEKANEALRMDTEEMLETHDGNTEAEAIERAR